MIKYQYRVVVPELALPNVISIGWIESEAVKSKNRSEAIGLSALIQRREVGEWEDYD